MAVRTAPLTGRKLRQPPMPPSPPLASSPIKRSREPQAHRWSLETLYRILKDAKENYPAWLEAIASARSTIHFETYIIHRDDIGLQFAEALAERARQGVRVRLLYDWLGSFSVSLRPRWPMLAQAGVEVRCLQSPANSTDPSDGSVETIARFLRLMDGLGFVSGLCVGRRWVGDIERHLEPWRDTGVVIEGPAVADVELAFAETWATAGAPLPTTDLPDRTPYPQRVR